MDQRTRWWENFFTGLIAELPPLYPEAHTQADADFLSNVFAPKPGQRIADIPCGSGRISLALAARGFDVTGIDFTPSFIDAAARTVRERGVKAAFECREMRNLPWVAEFDFAFCFGNSFPYFDDAGNAEYLARIAGILKPGGRFMLETNLAAESVLTQLTQPLNRRWYLMGDIYFLHETSYDPVKGCLTSNYTLIRGSQVEHKQAIYPIYTYREFVRMFEAAGFRNVESYGSLEREPYHLGCTGLWLVATHAS